jgi:protein tyrosine phosphatase (PTP) superfamily phosphohydrolase (DUF442 family)
VRIVVLASIVATVPAGAVVEDHVFVQNVHVVETGAVIRGAEQKPWPLARVIDRYAVRTVLCLADPEPREQEIAADRGVRWVHVPLSDSRTQVMFGELERAAAVLAEPSNRPVFFHCKRGVYRSNLVHAVYRMKFCGWSLDRTLAELRTLGFDPAASGGDNCCRKLLERYDAESVR